MCVSNHKGIKTRVGRSGFYLFLQYLVIVPKRDLSSKIRKLTLILDKFCLQNLINFSQSGPIYLILSILNDPQ